MKKIPLILISLVFVLIGCNNNVEHTEIDWVDFVKLNGETYEGIYDGILSDPSLVGKETGKVKFTIADNVHSTNYKIKNGDAAFLDKGTKIFEVKGNKDFIVVKDDKKVNGYKIYVKEKSNSHKWLYKDINKEKVNKIEVLDSTTVEVLDEDKESLITIINNKAEINQFFSILDNGNMRDGMEIDNMSPDYREYLITFYTGSPVAIQYKVYFNGVDYFWHPDYTEVIPPEISEFLK